MPSELPLQLLLRPAWRNPEGISRVRDVLKSLGLRTSSSGRATMSARGSLRVVTKIFGADASRLAELTRDAPLDTGSTALRVPPELEDYVESVSVLPPPTLMDGPS